jgi:hypothetical protein
LSRWRFDFELGYRTPESMHKLEFTVSAEAYNRIQQRCELFQCTIQEYLLNHIFDHLLDEDDTVETGSYEELVAAIGSESVGRPTSTLSVASEFPASSNASHQWAQAFVDKALSYPGVTIFKSGPQSIGFAPNDVYIERIYTARDGFAASFFGRLSEHRAENPYAIVGRNPSYTRMKVKSQEQLFYAIKSIELARRLRNGTI